MELETQMLSRKIHLVWPNSIEYVTGVFTPLGIGYITSYLMEKGFDVEVHDLTFDKLVVGNERAVYGISITTPLLGLAMDAIEKIKKANPDNIIIVGGPHATSVYTELIKNELIDYVVVGEGEETFLELCKKLLDGDSVTNVKGICYKDLSGSHFTGKRDLIKNIDLLPFPSHDKFPLNKYLENRSIREMPIISSRGCPFNCEFCQPYLRNTFGRAIRHRSPENVVDELELLKDKFGAQIVVFNDDMVNPVYIKEICEEIIKRKVHIFWRCQARAHLDESLLRLMKKAGCVAIAFGVESGSQKVLDAIDKKLKVADIEEVFKNCRKVGMFAHAYIMVGNSGENMDDIRQTIEMLRKIKPFSISVSITTAYPGTRLFERLKREGKIPKEVDWAKMHHLKMDTYYVQTSELSQEEVTHAKKMIMDEFKKTGGRFGYIFSYLKDLNGIFNVLYFTITNPGTVIRAIKMLMSISKTGSGLKFTNPKQTFYGKDLGVD